MKRVWDRRDVEAARAEAMAHHPASIHRALSEAVSGGRDDREKAPVVDLFTREVIA